MRRTSLKSTKSSINEIKATRKYDDADALSRSISLNTGNAFKSYNYVRNPIIALDAHAGGKQRLFTGRHGPNPPTEVFTFRELAMATENFNTDNLLGQGGFGRVYKGCLKKSNQVPWLLLLSLY